MPPKLLLLSLVVVVVSTAMWKLATVGASEPPISPQTVAFTLVSQSDPNVYPRSAVYRTRVRFCEMAKPELLGLHNGIYFFLWEAGRTGVTFDFHNLNQALRQQFDALQNQNLDYPETAIRIDFSWYQASSPGVEMGSHILLLNLVCEELWDNEADVCDVTITWDQPINGLGELPTTIEPIALKYTD